MKSAKKQSIAQNSSLLERLKTREYFWRFNYLGVVFATVFFCLSLLPSLLPRPWLYQGIISGLSLSIGYGIGTAVSKTVRWMTESDVPKSIKRIAWRALILLAPVSMLIFLHLGSTWQDQVRDLVGEAPSDNRYLIRITLLSVSIFLIVLSVSRGIHLLNHWLITQIDRLLPKRVSIVIGTFLVFLFVFWLFSGLAAEFFVSKSNTIYRAKNDTTPPDITQPASPYRSGSKESLIAWDTLGYQGKSFVASGPSQSQLSGFSSSPSMEQVRTYVGLKSAPTPQARAELAVAELKRTKAFERKILVLATTTGTGWLEPQSVDSIEYMYNGDSAIVTQQYSYLPSWISFLVDKDNATDAGQALFNAVWGEWSKLPKDTRPKLIAYGLSLGSFGGQAAYSGVNDLRLSIDGALFMGTPNDTLLWRNVTNQRDPGSPEWQPIYQDGRAVRFAATNQDIDKPGSDWQQPRILYMQHASDPVVWFNFDLLLNKPAWLSESRGSDVSPTMRWYPFVTFLQVGVDQFFGTTVPNGHGHNYPNTIVNAWSAVTPPPDWTASKATQLQKIIDTYSQ